MESKSFAWPAGKRAALSITFDDSRPSQVDYGVPILDKYGVKATFYVLPSSLPERLPAWKRAVRNGHEMGNHTVTHPCSGNFFWARSRALQDYSLRQMDREFRDANRAIKKLLGITPATFAYPCGHKFVGSGTATKSYVPLVAKHFNAGRGFPDEAANDAAYCSMAQLFGVDYDRGTLAKAKIHIQNAVEFGGWLILVAHDVGRVRQGVTRKGLEDLCRYATNPKNGLWVDTVENIARYVRTARKATSVGM